MVEAGLLTAFQVGHLLRGRAALVLGKYVVLDQLGGGGMSAVFLARHQDTEQRVAIKMLPAEMANDPAPSRASSARRRRWRRWIIATSSAP